VSEIKRYEAERGKSGHDTQDHTHPTDSPKPGGTHHPIKHHIPPHPTGQ
jgi:hypothetical protein